MSEIDQGERWPENQNNETNKEVERLVQERLADLNEKLLQEVARRQRAEKELVQQENRLREIQRIANIGSWEYDIASKSVWWSDEIYWIFETTPEEFRSSDDAVFEIIHPDDRKAVSTAFYGSLKGHVPYDMVHRLLLKDGRIKYVHARSETVFDDSGKPVRSVGTAQDVTEQEIFGRKLAESERNFRLVTETIQDIFWLSSPNVDKMIYISPAYEKIWGRTTQSLYDAPESFLDVLHPDDLENFKNVVMCSHYKGEGYSAEYRIVKTDGSIRWIFERGFPVLDEHGSLVNMCGISSDITERKYFEEALKKSEERFRQVAGVTGEWIWEVDEAGKIKYSSSALKSILGYDPDEVVDRFKFWDLFQSGQDQVHLDEVKASFNSCSEFRNLQLLHNCKDDKQVVVETTGFPILDNNGKFSGYRGVSRDITELVKAAESRDLLAAVVEHGPEAVEVTDHNGLIKYVNPAFVKTSGYDYHEAVGSNPRFLKSGKHDESFYRNLWDTITSGHVWKGHFINKKKDGSLFQEEAVISPIFDVRGNITNYVAVKRDVTKEVALQKQLLQSQKMEAIGTLAGGIAHDFNNIIFGIIGFTELALDLLPADSEAGKKLLHVLDASSRAADMVKQILTFSRQSDTELQNIDISPLIKEGVKFLRASIPSTIEIRQQIASRAGNVRANPTQIHQVLMNLCANAAHAMRDSRGILSIELTDVILDAEFCSQHALPVPGQYVLLEVSDTGQGIPPELIQRIFEPYFTTKAVDEGTGMGLAVVHGIVKNHRGAITVHSEIDTGTTFRVYFPAILHDDGIIPSGSRSDILNGSERILLVDDEQIIVEMEKAILQHLGYKVVHCINPEEALRIFKDDPKGFDLIMTDLTMPHMTGTELLSKIHIIRPDIPVILCTGYGHKLDKVQIEKSGATAVINKPLRKKDLARIIRNALGDDEKT